jgi:signal transduction histidine kinase
LHEHLDSWGRILNMGSSTAVSGSGGAHDHAGAIASKQDTTDGSEPAAAKSARAASPVDIVRPTLLVVDDERDVLDSVRDWLRISYRVITFQHGAEALEYLKSDQLADVILCDQRMPEMTGVEVLCQAKAIRPETTRLLFTAYMDIRTVIDAINEGHVFRYIAKPCDPDELSVVVRQAVEHRTLIVEKTRLLAELKESNARLLETNRLKGAFIEVASHELNTPVTVMLGMIDLWKLSQAQNASAAERQWVDRIGAAAGRLAKTVEKMLKLIRNREFSQSVDVQPIELEAIVRQAIADLSPYLERRSQVVSVSIEPDIGPLEADASKISDVLTNLLANAVKFTPDGGTIRLEVRAEPPQGDWIRVSVRDQGAGVSQGDQQYVFEPFFTGFDTLRHSSGEYEFGKRGIGLGLWLVKTFVELHGGRVEVSSTPGAGATFSFLLPRSPVVLSNKAPDQTGIRVASDTIDAERTSWTTAV